MAIWWWDEDDDDDDDMLRVFVCSLYELFELNRCHNCHDYHPLNVYVMSIVFGAHKNSRTRKKRERERGYFMLPNLLFGYVFYYFTWYRWLHALSYCIRTLDIIIIIITQYIKMMMMTIRSDGDDDDSLSHQCLCSYIYEIYEYLRDWDQF